MFIASYALLSLPLSFITTMISVGILMPVLDFNLSSWIYASGVLWASFVVTENATLAALMLIKRPITAAITVLYFTLISIVIASGVLRSFRGLPDWLYSVSTALPSRYASLALNQLAIDMSNFDNLPYNETIACPGPEELCRYENGRSYLKKRFTIDDNLQVLDVDLNLLISLAFSVGFVIFNSVLYLLPLPASIKIKFRE